MSPISIVGPWGNDWMFMEAEPFALQYPEWFSEFEAALYGDSGSSAGEEEEPVWYNFIVNEEEIGSWAVVATWDMEFELFYLWTGEDEVCVLTPDWKSDNKEDNIWGFFVSEDPSVGSCPFVEEYGFTYSSYTFDNDTMAPLTMVGPWGNDWMFWEPEGFALQYPEWFAEFQEASGEGMDSDDKEGDEPFWYNFIV